MATTSGGVPEISADRRAVESRDDIDHVHLALQIDLEDFDDYEWHEKPGKTANNRIWDIKEYQDNKEIW
jgi:hypothetical protein